jgi:hypothetical protein
MTVGVLTLSGSKSTQYRRCRHFGEGRSMTRAPGWRASRATAGSSAARISSAAAESRKVTDSSVSRRSVGVTSASVIPAARSVSFIGYSCVGCGETSTKTRWPSSAAADTACWKRTGSRRFRSQ